MKKILNIFILLASILITMSCSKDDESNNAIEQQPTIIGTWEWSAKGNIDAEGNITNLTPYLNDCSSMKDSWLFTADGTFVMSESNSSCTTFYDNYEYNLNGSTINYSGNGTVGSFIILSQTTNTLKVKFGYINRAVTANYYEFTRRN